MSTLPYLDGAVRRTFLVVSVELRWGALCELGRSDAVADERSPQFDDMELELPDGVPPRAFLKFGLYEWNRHGRHRLIGAAGAPVHELQPHDPRGRGVPLVLGAPPSTLRAPTAERGTLWVDRCELLTHDDTPPSADPLPPTSPSAMASPGPALK